MTPFGKILRRERKERGLSLGDCARTLGISTPYLSQLENGNKPLQDGFVDKVIKKLGIIGNEANAMHRAAASSMSEFRIKLRENAHANDRILASQLATGFARLSAEEKEQIRNILVEDKRG